jgi:Domain of unknown function (DUF222)
MRVHRRPGRRGRQAIGVAARRRLAKLDCPLAVSERQAEAAAALHEHAAADVEHHGVFGAAEVRRRAELAAFAGAAAGSVAALPGVGELPTLTPGPRLAALLGDLTADGGDGGTATAPAGLRSLSQFSLVEVASAAERLASWAAAVQADALGVLADRQTVPTLPAGVIASSISRESMAGRLVAARVCWSPRTGESRVRDALRLRSELSATLSVLRTGRICPRRARVIVDGTATVTPQVARRVEATVLPKAERLTAAKLRQLIEKLIAADDPDGGENRHAEAVKQRDVCSYPLPDGMAEIVAKLSAEDAEAVMAALNAAAVAMKTADPDDPRTLAQRRADALAEIGWGALASGWLTPQPHTCRPGAPEPDPADPEPGAAAASGDGTDAEPGAEANPHDDGADPSADTDTRASTGDASGARPAGAAGTCGCGGRWLASRSGRPVSVRVTVPLSTLIGIDDLPVELAGYGPIPASVARRLAAHGTWRRLLTDPVSGAVLDYGTTRYRPPPDLIEIVHARDRTCRWPGCHHPGANTQTDHLTPAAAGGPTSAAGLAAECWPCHLAKTHTGWHVEQPQPGRFKWTAPDGHRYTVDPEPVGPIIGAGFAEATSPQANDPDPPPF